MLIDSHAHLEASTSLKELRGASVDDLEGVLKRAVSDNVGEIITIGTSIQTSKKAVEIADKYSTEDLQIRATCGLHPNDAKDEIKKLGIGKSIEELRALIKSSSKVVGVGEAGLDYYLGSRVKGLGASEEEKIQQRVLFEAQIRLADELSLPLVIHCRNGWDEIFRLLSIDDRLLTSLKGVFHSFTGDWKAAQKALALGFYISFSGIVTFGNASTVQNVARKMPIDRMLIETDSPFLAPEPHRGSVNEPKNVKIVARIISNLRDVSLDTIEEATTKNAQELFGL